MPFFNFIAATNSGELKHGEMEARDREAVIDFLQAEKLMVVSVKTKAPDLATKIIKTKKISYPEKISFAENLGTMIKAGVNLTEALEMLIKDSTNARLTLVLNDLKFSVENGKSLSAALADFKEDFGPVFISLVKAGEASGKVSEALLKLAVQLKKEYALVSKIKSALIYPFVLLAGVLGVIILIITFVLPRLVTIFEGGAYNIPFTTKTLFFLSRWASKSPLVTFGLLVVLIIVFVIILKQTKVRRSLAGIVFRLPVASTLFRQLEMIRFCRTTGELLESGISIGQALDIASSGVTLKAYQKLILDAKEKILKGVSLANAFRGNERYFSNLLLSVINVGEKTGHLDSLLLNLADFYEEQTDNTLKTLSGLVEPVMLVVVGILIGGMAISIVVPIYQLIGSI